MPLHVSNTSAHHPEVKIALHNLWYHHTHRWPSRAQVEGELSVINQLDAQNFYFTINFFFAYTYFEQMCSSSGIKNYISQRLVSLHP